MADLPTVVSAIPPDLRRFLDRVRETLASLATTNYVKEAIASIPASGTAPDPGGGSGGTTPITPPVVGGLSATGSVTHVLLEWTLPTYSGRSHTEIWRSSTDDLGAAVAVGQCPGSIFSDPVDTDSTYYYWVRDVSITDTVGAFNAVPGTVATTGKVGNSQLADLAVDDAKIIDLTAAKIKSGELSVDTEITVGGHLRISGQGWIESYSAANYGINGDYTRLDQGNLKLYRYVPALAGTVLYNFLSRAESGIANNNDVVLIPGYFASQPKISVFPASIGSYSAAYSSQSQTLVCQATEITETSPGSMRYQFRALANLAIAAGTGAVAVNATSGDLTAATTYSSGTYNTPSNCVSITPTVNLTSFRSISGTTCQQRSVNWRVRYTGDGGGGAWRTKAIGVVITAVTDSYTFTFPAAGLYSFWIEYSAADAAGTFVASGLGYESTNTTLNSPGTTTNSGTRRTINMPAYSPPSGWVIDSVYWSWQAGWYIMGGFVVVGLGISAGPPGSNRTLNNNGGTSSEYFPMTTYGVWQSTYNPSACYIDSYDIKNGSWGGGSAVYTGYPSATASATIYLKRYLGYTASGQNRFDFASYGYTLSANSILATGTLNWMAVGP